MLWTNPPSSDWRRYFTFRASSSDWQTCHFPSIFFSSLYFACSWNKSDLRHYCTLDYYNPLIVRHADLALSHCARHSKTCISLNSLFSVSSLLEVCNSWSFDWRSWIILSWCLQDWDRSVSALCLPILVFASWVCNVEISSRAMLSWSTKARIFSSCSLIFLVCPSSLLFLDPSVSLRPVSKYCLLKIII